MTKLKPVIKWSGSKSSQAYTIANLAPHFNKYFEPFIGGGSVLYALYPQSAVCGDICKPLIDLWNLIKTEPSLLSEYYAQRWEELQSDYMAFYRARDRFNKDGNPKDFLFLIRTCVNGLIRFNGNGEFNNSLHYTRKGIDPTSLQKILFDWHNHIQNIEFVCMDYRESTATAKEGDFIYLDPPYFNTKGRYYGKINYDDFFAYLRELNNRNIKYALSFDGSRGINSYSVDLPQDLYVRKEIIKSGKSTFRKVIDNVSEDVFETLYLNW
ncbi:MAG: DNA adenine methylase [Roseburia sp.]|nr:DNA adenine methylase [Roseburia sp.]